jgi:hypothetical protein
VALGLRTAGLCTQLVSWAFSSLRRSILTQIYQCHASSCHELENQNACTGAGAQAGEG